MSTETILILGGSFAGIGAAHYALQHTIPQLSREHGKTYTVTLVNPSADFYWRIAGPRAAVSKELMPPSKYLYPIEPAFAYAKGTFNLIQGSATQVDTLSQTVSVTSSASGQQQTIPYAALIIATGVSTPSPLFTQTTNGSDLESTHDAFQKSLSAATHVVIGGGGPVGVEAAGEIAECLNGKPRFMASGLPKHAKAKVTLICADSKLLPVLRKTISLKAEGYLKRLGVEVLYDTHIVSANCLGEGFKTVLQLHGGRTIDADLYVEATGVRPNTSFLPTEWLDSRGRVACHPRTLRVEAAAAGSFVYVLGDVGSYTRGGILDMANAVPVALTNLKTDLVARISGEAPGLDRLYRPNLKEQQLAPIGTAKGIGAFGGWRLPSWVIWWLKGRDYCVGLLALKTINGNFWKKEKRWKPEVDQTELSSG